MPFLWGTICSLGNCNSFITQTLYLGPTKRKTNKLFLLAFLSSNSLFVPFQRGWAVFKPLGINNKHQQRQLLIYAAFAAKSCDRCYDVWTVSPSLWDSHCHYLWWGCGKPGLLAMRYPQSYLCRGEDRTKLRSNTKVSLRNCPTTFTKVEKNRKITLQTCSCVQVHMCILACEDVTPQVTLTFFFFLRQDLSVAWNWPSTLIWLVSEPEGSTCLARTGLQAWLNTWLFYVGSRTGIGSHAQILYWLAFFLSRPRTTLFKKEINNYFLKPNQNVFSNKVTVW